MTRAHTLRGPRCATTKAIVALLSPSALLIDMDGVLVDSEPLWEQVTDDFCRRRGARYDEHDVVACVGRGIRHSAVYLAERYGFAGSADEHTLEILADFAKRAPGVAACAGAESLLRGLRGRIPLALGTSSSRAVVEASLGARGWLPLFDAIVTGDDVAHPKPAPDIYARCAALLGVEVSRALVLEDSLPGATSGKAAGAQVIAVLGPARAPMSPDLVRVADHVARDLVEVLALLAVARSASAVPPRHDDHAGTERAV